MEFLEQAASSRVAIVTVTGRGEARPDQSLSVQVCSLGFPGAGSLNARAAWEGGLFLTICVACPPTLSVEKREWIVHTGKGLPPRVCLCLSIHLIGAVQNLSCGCTSSDLLSRLTQDTVLQSPPVLAAQTPFLSECGVCIG